jgi:hypothetical protein
LVTSSALLFVSARVVCAPGEDVEARMVAAFGPFGVLFGERAPPRRIRGVAGEGGLCPHGDLPFIRKSRRPAPAPADRDPAGSLGESADRSRFWAGCWAQVA